MAFLALIASAHAHESRPLFIEITEKSGNIVSVRTVIPASVELANMPGVALEAPCVLTQEPRRRAKTIEADYDCARAQGARLSIAWPAFNPSITTLVRMKFAAGEVRTALLDPETSSWTILAAPSFAGVARSYFIIGVEHIVGGVDHVLFLAGLLFIAGSLRRAIVTATGFTIAHSLTLCLVALDVIRVSVPATEAVIALSIVFLAAEIARGNRQTLAWRRPALVASAFGLVHGAGFAAALGEIGLPAGEKTAALMFFNLGVEAGQLALIASVFMALFAVKTIGKRDVSAWNQSLPLSRVAGYALGVVSAYWFIERAAAIFAA